MNANMYFSQGKVASLAIVLVMIVYLSLLASKNTHTVLELPPPKPWVDSRANPACTDALRMRVDVNVTYRSFQKIFGGCANTSHMSRDSFNAIFTSKTFTDVECPPRRIRFLETRRPKIALSSYKGSGNTWTRHLLEQLTGIWTGDVYTDYKLIPVFAGEILCPTSNKTFIIKSHEWSPYVVRRYPGRCKKEGIEDYDKTLHTYDGAILLLRNPYDAFLAAFNRIHGGHTSAPNRTLLVDNTREWRHFLFNGHVDRWRNMTEYWLTEFDGRLHVLFYENLRASLPFELYRLSVFLKTPVSYRTLWCTLKRGRGEFQRQKPGWFVREKLYARDMQRAVDKQIEAVETMLRDSQVLHPPYRLR